MEQFLGYEREKNIITNDDDIDIYIKNNFKNLLKCLSKTNFTVNLCQKKMVSFLRKPLIIKLVQDDIKTYVDFRTPVREHSAIGTTCIVFD